MSYISKNFDSGITSANLSVTNTISAGTSAATTMTGANLV
jgi:hypothetical protein